MTDHKELCETLRRVSGASWIGPNAADLIEQQAALIADQEAQIMGMHCAMAEMRKREESPWRSMGEAPSGIYVLCVDADGDEFILRFRSDDWRDSHGWRHDPIAWMPIPKYQEQTK